MLCAKNCSVSLAKRECSDYEHALFAGVINSLINLVFTMHRIKDVKITWEPYASHDLLGPNHT